MIKEDMIEAIKVMFIKQIHEDDFPEKGMKAWLTDVVRDEHHMCWELYFDFTDFEKENDKYLKNVYYLSFANEKGTAKQAGYYKNKYSVYFGDTNTEAYGSFEEQISKYLKAIDDKTKLSMDLQIY